jgi:hypothetical protein
MREARVRLRARSSQCHAGILWQATAARVCRASAPRCIINRLNCGAPACAVFDGKPRTQLSAEEKAARDRLASEQQEAAALSPTCCEVACTSAFSIANGIEIVTLGSGAPLPATADAVVQIACEAAHLFHAKCLGSNVLFAVAGKCPGCDRVRNLVVDGLMRDIASVLRPFSPSPSAEEDADDVDEEEEQEDSDAEEQEEYEEGESAPIAASWEDIT